MSIAYTYTLYNVRPEGPVRCLVVTLDTNRTDTYNYTIAITAALACNYSCAMLYTLVVV
jgi:hypothetical protein